MTVGIAQVFNLGTYMLTGNSVNHIQIFRLRSFAELRCLLKFSGGKLTPPYLSMERGWR
jgi:hypothetical protein